MRSRKEIEKEVATAQGITTILRLLIEVNLDTRELLNKRFKEDED